MRGESIRHSSTQQEGPTNWSSVIRGWKWVLFMFSKSPISARPLCRPLLYCSTEITVMLKWNGVFDALWCVQNDAGARGILKCPPTSFAVQLLSAWMQLGSSLAVWNCALKTDRVGALSKTGALKLSTRQFDWRCLSQPINSAGFSALRLDQFVSIYETLRKRFKQWIFSFLLNG